MTQATDTEKLSDRLRRRLAGGPGARVWAVSGLVVLAVLGGAAALWMVTGPIGTERTAAESDRDRARERAPAPEPIRLDTLPASEGRRRGAKRSTSANAAPVIGVGTERFSEPTEGVAEDPAVDVDGSRPNADMASDEEIKRQLAALERANARIERALRNSQGPDFGSGELIWPVRGPVTSPFGQRWGRLHAGIDIGVPTGTPVHAADSGRVAVSGSVGGYGNYICIQHTRSLSTCYGHNSQLGVRKGESVRKGSVISRAGCTGSCTGPHVHFEVRVGGRPVDPMRYL